MGKGDRPSEGRGWRLRQLSLEEWFGAYVGIGVSSLRMSATRAVGLCYAVVASEEECS